jgi:hypothetical protein
MDHIDPIGRLNFFIPIPLEIFLSDGVVLVDPEYVKDRKVYASVLAGRISD